MRLIKKVKYEVDKNMKTLH